MLDCNPVRTPLDPNVVLWPRDAILARTSTCKEKEGDVALYQSIVGQLMYAMTCTRPDLAFTCSLPSRFNSSPMLSYLTAAKQAFRYLKGRRHFRLTYSSKFSHENTILRGFSDSDYTGDTQFARSTTGYVLTLYGAAFCWKSRRQTTTARAAEEAEYMALADTSSEAMWIQELNAEILSTDPSVLPIHSDSMGAINRALEAKYHGRLKHITVRYHFVRHVLDSRFITISHIPSLNNVADILTKPLGLAKHITAVKGLGPLIK